MTKNLVTQHNSLINSQYRLDLIEKRLILLAIAKSKQSQKNITSNDFLEIYAKDYVESFGVESNTSYEVLKVACKQLFSRYFVYQNIMPNGKIEHVESRWVSRISYIENEGKVRLIFAPDVIPLINDLYSCFTSYFLADIANMTSQYAIRLYELVISWRSVGETPIFELNDLKQKLGVLEEDYPRMFDFKKRVLDIGINQINEHSNISLIAIQHKKGRVISGFSFAFKVIDEKPKRKKITKKQAEEMANVGESYKDLYSRLSKEYLILE
jgi:plasmid replication initiation protein